MWDVISVAAPTGSNIKKGVCTPIVFPIHYDKMAVNDSLFQHAAPKLPGRNSDVGVYERLRHV